jgi:hypothetical protein
VTPTDYATAELASWEQALRLQRELEEQLQEARQKGHNDRILDLMPEVRALRTRADLLLAEAVKVKCEFRDERFLTAWVSSTQSHFLEDGMGE